MATIKRRLYRKNASGSYDTVHYESESSLILRPSGRTVEQDLADFLPKTQASDSPPASLLFGGICTVGTSGTNSARLYYGAGNSSPIEVAQQSDVDSLKSSVSEGKSLIASAITDKGVSTSSTATFQTMATNIGKIKGIQQVSGTVISTGNKATVTGSYITSPIIPSNAQYGTFTVKYKYDGGSYMMTVIIDLGILIGTGNYEWAFQVGAVGQEIYGGFSQKVSLYSCKRPYFKIHSKETLDTTKSVYVVWYS